MGLRSEIATRSRLCKDSRADAFQGIRRAIASKRAAETARLETGCKQVKLRNPGLLRADAALRHPCVTA